MRIGALDLGSNSFHGLVAEVDALGELSKLWSHKDTLRLGAVVAAHGLLPPDAFSGAVDSVCMMTRAARELCVQRLAIVGTSALREADNGAEFARAIECDTGVPVEILSGDAEAELVYRGARARLARLPARVGVIDLGGGSVEVAVGERSRLLYTGSLPLGFLRLKRQLGLNASLDPAASSAVEEHVAEITSQLLYPLVDLKPQAWVLTGGTARALRKLWPSPTLSAGLLSALAGEFARLPPELLIAQGVDTNRAESFGLGVTLLATLVERFGASVVQVSQGGLREGVVLREYQLGRNAAQSQLISALAS